MSTTATYYGVERTVSMSIENMGLREIETTLGGELELLQLDGRYCLLTNAQAREQMLPKNKAASQFWFDRHPESGAGADFIQGAVIHCLHADVAHLQHLQPAARPVLTALERAERAQLLAASARQQQSYEEAKLLCSLDNPESCEMCGS